MPKSIVPAEEDALSADTEESQGVHSVLFRFGPEAEAHLLEIVIETERLTELLAAPNHEANAIGE